MDYDQPIKYSPREDQISGSELETKIIKGLRENIKETQIAAYELGVGDEWCC
jgi:hypothetical protein